MSEEIQDPDPAPIEFKAPLQAVTDAQVAEWEWKNDIRPRLITSSLDPRFWRDIQDWGCKRQEDAYRQATGLCRGTGAIVALVGKRGAGKTTIAAQMIIDRVKRWAEPPHDPPSPYRKLSELIARFKSLYADFGSVETDQLLSALKAICSHRFLVIDEIHECDDQKMKTRVLTDLLDRRYARLKDTLIVSNQTPQEFQASTSDSILSRLGEHGAIIPCNWQSWREKH